MLPSRYEKVDVEDFSREHLFFYDDAEDVYKRQVESLRADIIILILVNFPVSRRPGNGRSVHLSFLGFCHAGCFVRGDLCLLYTS